MPTVTKTKTHSKCRQWEQVRRKRLGEAFSNLAAILPSHQATSAASTGVVPNTKILILQQSLHYIKQLQAATDNKPRHSAVDVAVETEQLDEVKILQAKCLELVKLLIQARVPLPAPPANPVCPARKYATVAAKNKSEINNCTGKENENSRSCEENDVQCEPLQEEDLSKLIVQVDGESERHASVGIENVKSITSKKKSNKGSTTPHQQSTIRGGKSKESKGKRNIKKKFNMNRKHIRKKVKRGETPGGSDTSTSHNVTNTSSVWVTNAALRGSVVLPFIPSVLPSAPPTILINPFPFPFIATPRKSVHGFDITKTTMVNKVPIPATALSMEKRKALGKSLKPLPKVTYQSKCKMMRALKATKKAEKKNNVITTEGEVVKVTEVKADTPQGAVKRETETVAGGHCSPDYTHKSTGPSKCEPKTKETIKKSTIGNINNPVTSVDPQAMEQESNKEIGEVQTNDKDRVEGIEQNNHLKESVQASSNNGDVIKYGDGQSVEELIERNVEESNNNSHSNNSARESGARRKRVDDNPNGRDRQEMAGDITEELSLPSPTAAFLLTFPLVCSGPSEPMQPPQDHFSNYFSRDSAVSSTNQGNMFMSSDMIQTKSSPRAVENTRTTWAPTPSTSTSENKTNYSSESRSLDKGASMKESNKDSTTCIFSGSQNLFPATSACNNNNYAFSESIFNYEHTPVGGGVRGVGRSSSNSHNTKVPFNFDNLHFEHKQLVNENLMSSSSATGNDATSSLLCNSTSETNIFPSALPNSDSSKKNYDGSMPCKLKGGLAAHTKASLPSTLANAYNPFDMPVTSSTLVSNSVPSNSVKSWSSNMYFPDFASNIQNCNPWMEDNTVYGGDYSRADGVKKANSNTVNFIQNYALPVGMDVCVSSATLKNHNSSTSVGNKNSVPAQINKPNVKPTGKISVKESKYLVQDNKDLSTQQKGPINWMTSEVNFGQLININSQEGFLNSNNQRVEQSTRNMLSGTNQPCAMDGLAISGLSGVNKKAEFYEQPFYMPPGGFVPQPLNEDHQFTWSPSKLMPSTDTAPLVTCSLPTLVGDLALSMGDAKQTYQHLFLEQSDNSVLKNNEKRNVDTKSKTPVKKNLHKVQCEMNPSAGSFLSVSQIMERGKEDNVYQENITAGSNHIIKANMQTLHCTQSRNVNKITDVPMVPAEVFGVPQMGEYFPPPPPLHKAMQKNVYSTESLLQSNESHYVTNKSNRAANKTYEASNLCISSNVASNNTLPNQPEYDTNNFSNSYSYPGGVNAPFHTTSNYFSSSTSYPCYNMSDVSEYTPVEGSFYNKPDVSNKYHYENKNVLGRNQKNDQIKKDLTSKRVRKGGSSKVATSESYPQRFYLGGGCSEDAPYSQMSLNNFSSLHKTSGSHKSGDVSPNHSGTSSLANFHLSSIFPEINKRPALPAAGAYNNMEASHKPTMSIYL